MLHFQTWTGSNEHVQVRGQAAYTVCPSCDICRKADITRLLPGWLTCLVNTFMAKDWLDLAATPLSELLDGLTQVSLLVQGASALRAGAGCTGSDR